MELVGIGCERLSIVTEAKALQGKFVLTLGGDHSIAAGSIKYAPVNKFRIFVPMEGHFYLPFVLPAVGGSCQLVPARRWCGSMHTLISTHHSRELFLVLFYIVL